MKISIENHEKIHGDATRERLPRLNPEEADVFARWLRVLEEARVPYVVAGAFALHEYAGVWRDTKDLDIFLKPSDLKKAFDALEAAGYRTEVRDVHWLAKAYREPYFLDLIFSLANTYIVIDDAWIASARPSDLLGVQAPIIGLEELIVSKFYVTRSDRFDGADIAHLIRSAEGGVDWSRILELLREDWQLLLWHLTFFDYVYPGHSECLPKALMAELFERMQARWSRPREPRPFNGVIVDPLRFSVDVEDWGYLNRRPARKLVNERGEPK